VRPERGAGSEKGLGVERERRFVVDDDGVRLLGYIWLITLLGRLARRRVESFTSGVMGGCVRSSL
jgi:hypothetical protein